MDRARRALISPAPAGHTDLLDAPLEAPAEAEEEGRLASFPFTPNLKCIPDGW